MVIVQPYEASSRTVVFYFSHRVTQSSHYGRWMTEWLRWQDWKKGKACSSFWWIVLHLTGTKGTCKPVNCNSNLCRHLLSGDCRGLDWDAPANQTRPVLRDAHAQLQCEGLFCIFFFSSSKINPCLHFSVRFSLGFNKRTNSIASVA